MRINRALFVRNNALPELLRSVVSETCKGRGVGELPWHRRRRFFSTAAMASGVPERPQGSRKRISKRERRTMVESFVNKYRTLNEGKFPILSVTHKEVGGSYYVIREILQEVKCKSVHNPVVEIAGNSLLEKRGVESKIIPEMAEADSYGHNQVDGEMERDVNEVEKVRCAKESVCTRGMQVLANKVETEVGKTVDAEVERESNVEEFYVPPMSRDLAGTIGDVSTNQKLAWEERERDSFVEHANHFISDKKYSENRKMSEMVGSSEKTLLEDAVRARTMEDVVRPRTKEVKEELITTSSSLQAEGTSSVPHKGEPPVFVDEKDVKSIHGFVKPENSPSKCLDDQISPGFDESRDNLMETADHNNGLQEKPSLWSNLKSFADGIFSIWRKK